MVYSYKEVVKILKKNGWLLKRTSGSHEIYVNSKGSTCPIKCTNKDIPIGTLKNIEKITGIKF
ncbi:MAG: addiction module toxin, HicA family [Tissierellia bacterium]|nr:addiction module toxin, HicA family [Tissierellia bacterium]